jgi:hypothetical protein
MLEKNMNRLFPPHRFQLTAFRNLKSKDIVTIVSSGPTDRMSLSVRRFYSDVLYIKIMLIVNIKNTNYTQITKTLL